MKFLLVDNSKADLCEFTRQLEKRLEQDVDVVCCTDIDDLKNTNIDEIDAVILSGSSRNISEPQKMEHIRKSICTLLRYNKPTLGICFGMQLIACAYGGVVKRLEKPIKKEETIYVEKNSILLNGESKSMKVTLSHQDYVKEAPYGFKVYAQNDRCIQIFESLNFLRFGVQFHPERKASNEKICIIDNFIKFVYERIKIPFQIDDEVRVNVLVALKNNQSLKEIESKFYIQRDLVMSLWRHHIRVWNLPAILF